MRSTIFLIGIFVSCGLSLSTMSSAYTEELFIIMKQNNDVELNVENLSSTTMNNATVSFQNVFIETTPLFQISNPDTTYLDDRENQLWQSQEDIQKHLAQEHEREAMNYSILNNKFYENENIQVFNYTAYNVQQLKNSLMNPAVSNTESNDFYISFGYGVVFKINRNNRVGYEYLSVFPYDRGQMIRFFWERNLKY